LNIAGALAALFHFIGKVNSPLTKGELNKNNAGKIISALKNINEVLGIIDFDNQVIQKEVMVLIDKREAARRARDWEAADSYRTELSALGVDVLDTAQGVIWRLK